MRSRQRGGIILKLMALLMLLGVLALLYLSRGPLLRAAGEFWVVNEPLEPSDAILLLSGDNYTADRASRAAELYRGRWAPRVVASGRQLRRYAGLAELTEHDLVERGVPAGAVVRLPHSAANTQEEAQALRQLVAERGWGRVLVVTSNYQTRRARYIFRRVFPRAVEVRVVAALDSDYDPDHWWESRLGVRLIWREMVGYCLAMWELRSAEGSGTAVQTPSRAPAGPQG
jgi:uncharacterized SAM-binding protein YcdF (DUF218 family)